MIIKTSGMGGFLNPPTHPEHTQHVQFDRRGSSCSLSYAAECDYINPSDREQARAILDAWQPLPIEHADVVAWIRQVLGYFRSCYQGDVSLSNESWNASNLTIDKSRDPMEWADVHAGVRLIRRYYPSYVPAREDFDLAKWGA